jgi:hypothetical protein
MKKELLMDKNNTFRKLRFERQQWFLNPHLLAVVISLVLFSLAWLIIPLNFLFFLLLLPIITVIWAASYGWRQVLSIILDGLHRLERF